MGRIRVLQNLSLYGSTCKYYKTYTDLTELILVLRNLYWYYGTYSYTDVLVGTTCSNIPRDEHLCLYQSYPILIREYP